MTAAYELFARNGVQAVGIDAIIERSGVARQTLYRHFGSKQDLVLAFLARREEVWTYGWLAAEVKRREQDPRRRLLAIFDVFDEWFRAPEFEGCSFINIMLEHPFADHPLHRAAADYLAQEVPQWARENHCYSCHNNGDAARALYAASRRGYKVPADALADTTAWLHLPTAS